MKKIESASAGSNSQEESTQITAPEQANQIDPKLASFIEKYRDRCSMFIKANGHVRLPIVKGLDGEYRWLNRKGRRKIRA